MNPPKGLTNIKSIGFSDASYPDLLKEIKNPPTKLFIKGDENLLSTKSITIVGTRKATAVGLKTAEDMARKFAELGITIVSGLALGIDSAAHEGALKGGGKTLAVLGNGVNKIYPAQNENLAEKIISTGGAVISEAGPDAMGHRGIFLERNRIIAGLAVATIIIEAPYKSGAINTAGWAADQGRPVFVIPGPINSKNYEGSHKLIRDGATLAASVDDVLEDLGIVIEKRSKILTDKTVNETEKMILKVLQDCGKPMKPDEIIEIAGLSAQRIMSAMATLVIKNIIIETPGGYTLS